MEFLPYAPLASFPASSPPLRVQRSCNNCAIGAGDPGNGANAPQQQISQTDVCNTFSLINVKMGEYVTTQTLVKSLLFMMD